MDGHATNQAADAAAKLPKALADFKEHMKQPAAAGEPLNTFHLTFTSEDTIDDADKFAKDGESVLKDNKAMLQEMGIRHVNYVVPQGSKSVRYFSYLQCHDYDEEALRRDMRACCPMPVEAP